MMGKCLKLKEVVSCSCEDCQRNSSLNKARVWGIAIFTSSSDYKTVREVLTIWVNSMFWRKYLQLMTVQNNQNYNHNNTAIWLTKNWKQQIIRQCELFPHHVGNWWFFAILFKLKFRIGKHGNKSVWITSFIATTLSGLGNHSW